MEPLDLSSKAKPNSESDEQFELRFIDTVFKVGGMELMDSQGGRTEHKWAKVLTAMNIDPTEEVIESARGKWLEIRKNYYELLKAGNVPDTPKFNLLKPLKPLIERNSKRRALMRSESGPAEGEPSHSKKQRKMTNDQIGILMKKMDKPDKQDDNIETVLKMILEELKKTNESIGKIQEGINKMQEGINKMQEGINKMQEGINKMQEGINKMQKDMKKMHEDVDELKKAEYSYHNGRITMPLNYAKCPKCGEIGHIASDCGSSVGDSGCIDSGHAAKKI